MAPSLRPRAIRCVLAGLTAGTLLLTACGNDSGGYTNKSADQLLADAVDTTLGLQSFSIDSRLQMTDGSEDFALIMTGAADYPGMVSDIKMTLTHNGPGAVMQVRSDGSKLWVKITGEQVPELPGGLEWVEGDVGRLANNADTFAVEPVGVLSPVILLKASDGAVEIGGEDELTKLTKFTTTVDYEAAVAAAGPLAADLQRGFRVTAREPVVLTIHVWLDDDGVVRKMEFTGGSGNVDAMYTLDLEAVNEPVEAPEPPDKSTVFSGPEADALLDQALKAR